MALEFQGLGDEHLSLLTVLLVQSRISTRRAAMLASLRSDSSLQPSRQPQRAGGGLFFRTIFAETAQTKRSIAAEAHAKGRQPG